MSGTPGRRITRIKETEAEAVKQDDGQFVHTPALFTVYTAEGRWYRFYAEGIHALRSPPAVGRTLDRFLVGKAFEHGGAKA